MRRCFASAVLAALASLGFAVAPRTITRGDWIPNGAAEAVMATAGEPALMRRAENPSVDGPPAKGASAARTPSERAAGVFNVRDFGAHSLTELGCDVTGANWVGPSGEHSCGAFDSTPAVNAAIAAAVAAGRGVVFFPSGRFGTYSTVNVTRPPGVDLSIVGENATIEVLAPNRIEAIFRMARTGSQASHRHHAVFRGLRLKGANKAFYGLRVAMDVGSDVVSISNVYVEGCAIGVDLEAVMESHVADLTLFNNTLGLRVRPDASGVAGGGNANDFVGVKITGGQVGILLYQSNDRLPFHNNTFTGTLVQGLGVAGIVLAGGLNHGQTFVGGHIENGLDPTGTGAVQVGDFGAERTIAVKKADLVLLSAEARLISLSPDSVYAAPHSEVEPARSMKLPRLTMEGGSLGGNSGTHHARFEVFDSRGVVLDYVKVVSRYGTAHAREFYRSAVITENVPAFATPGSNEVAKHMEVHAPAIATSEVNAVLGRTDVVTFAPSARGQLSNSYRRAFASPTRKGRFAYASIAMRADTDTTMVLGIAGEAARQLINVPLRAGKWTYIRMITARSGATLRQWVVVHPLAVDGPTVRIARPYAQNVDEPLDAAALFNGGAFLE